MQNISEILDNAYGYSPAHSPEISVKSTETAAKEIFNKLIDRLQQEPEKIKQIIVVRTDLKMGVGMLAAQVAHASMKVFSDRMLQRAGTSWSCNFTPEMVQWISGKFTKVVVGCSSSDELIDLQYRALEASIPNALVLESGLVATCLALGPDLASKLNKLIGKHKLL